jgi:hypothetical protein
MVARQSGSIYNHLRRRACTRQITKQLMRQRAFGYTDEDLRFIMLPMATDGQEPVGSMGTDTPLSCLSDRPQPLFHYFKQLFAQVTNPPIDPIREEMVMSLISYIGRERNILDETPGHCHTLRMEHPILTNRGLEKLRRVSQGDFLATTLPALFPANEGEKGLEKALDDLCRQASRAIKSGYTLLIISDRGVDQEYAPIPSLLSLAALHNHLVREGSRTQIALVVESGERGSDAFSLLMGYGATRSIRTWRSRRWKIFASAATCPRVFLSTRRSKTTSSPSTRDCSK